MDHCWQEARYAADLWGLKHSSPFPSSQVLQSETQNFQNNSVDSWVPSYWQTLRKSQTRGLWNKPWVPKRPINTSIVVNVSSFPCLDLPLRNDSVCLALECSLLACEVLFSRRLQLKKNCPEGQGVWTVIVPVWSPAWPWGHALSHLHTSLTPWSHAPKAARKIFWKLSLDPVTLLLKTRQWLSLFL